MSWPLSGSTIVLSAASTPSRVTSAMPQIPLVLTLLVAADTGGVAAHSVATDKLTYKR